MAAKRAPSRQSILLTFVFVVIATVFGAFYYRYVQDQEEYFTQRNFRQLTLMENQITSRIKGLRDVIENEIASGTGRRDSRSLEKRFQSLVPGYAWGSVSGNIGNASVRPVRGKASTQAWLFRDDDHVMLEFLWQNGMSGRDSISVLIRTTELTDLFRRKMDEKIFDELFIVVNENGNGKRIVQVPGGRVAIADPDTMLDADGKPLAFRSLANTDAIGMMQLRDETYRAFTHPFRVTQRDIHETRNSKDQFWTVCGLVRNERFNRDSLAISYNVLIVFVLIAMMIALCWPLLKLRFMSRVTRIRAVDVIFTVLAIMFGTSLVTIAFLDVLASYRLRNQVDGQLRSLSDRLAANFASEIDSARTQLRVLSDRAKTEILENNYVGNPKKTKNSYSLFSRASVETYPFFDQVFWVDNSGEERIKETVKDKAYMTSLVPVGDRDYFKNAVSGNLWDSRHDATGKDLSYYLQPLSSKTTGVFSVSMSMRLSLREGTAAVQGGDSLWVAAMDFRPMSVVAPVMPAGFDFCIIDGSGNVLFHSNQDRNLQENFFDECDEPGVLRASVVARSAEYVITRYWGQAHRMYIRPIEDLPFSLVTLHNEYQTRKVNLEIVTVALLLFFVYMIPFAIVVAIALLLPNDLTRWMWPDRRKTGHYRNLLVYYMVLAALFVISLCVTSHSASTFWTALIFPHFATVFTFLSLWARDPEGLFRRPKNRSSLIGFWAAVDGILLWLLVYSLRPDPVSLVALTFFIMVAPLIGWFLTGYPWQDRPILKRGATIFGNRKFTGLYVASMVSLLILGTVLPSVAFFNLGYDTHMRLYVKETQINLSRALQNREQSIREAFRKISHDHGTLSRRLAEERDTDAGIFFRTTRDRCANRPERMFDDWFDSIVIRQFMPSITESSVHALVLTHDAYDSSYSWNSLPTSGQDSLTMYHLLPPAAGGNGRSKVEVVSSVYPTFSKELMNWSIGQYAILLFLASVLLWILHHVVRMFIRKVLIIQADDPVQTEAEDLTKAAILRNTLIVDAGDELTESLGKRKDVRVIDFLSPKHESSAEQWKMQVQGKNAPQIGSVVIFHFENRFEDPVANEQKLLFLEYLVDSFRKPVVICSSIDPVSSFNLDVIRGERDISESVRRRWNWVFEGFERVADSLQFSDKTLLTDGKGVTRGSIESRLERIVQREFVCHRTMIELGNQLLQEGTVWTLSPTQLEDVIYGRSKWYYRRQWLSSTSDEKLVLARIATDGFANSNTISTVEFLLKRRLLVRDPEFRPFNDSFRRYILEAWSEEDSTKWQQEEAKSNWGRLRIPITIGLLLAVLFLFGTQREMYNATVTFVSAATILLPALFRLFGTIQPEKPHTAKES
ncbi:MAG: hypothetical protein HW389_467 [Bacteroidetes bacterium]|nr:hypothetical protein [Bacteroidota bacterium]